MPIAADEDFATRTAPFRSELVAHCYRMLGSVHEADDLVQETMLRAWRAWDRYDSERASVRTWLHRIATNACLNALEGRARRPLPSGLGPPSDDPQAPLVPAWEIPWLQPFPDARLGDPAVRVAGRSGLRLALVATLQLLPPRQRAALVLREILEFSAAEVADLLDTTSPAVHSALQRARATLSAAAPAEDRVDEPSDVVVRDLVDRYARAFENADVPALVTLLTDDAILEMPPVPLWYRGRADYGRFLARVFTMRGVDWRVVVTSANGQPALAAYCGDGDGMYRLHTLQVLTATPAGVTHNVVFQDPQVFAVFELPTLLADGP